jgi:hypothetical protein
MKNFKVKTEKNGAILTAEVSPCVYFYDNYPFQISISIENGNRGNAIKSDSSVDKTNITEVQVVALLNTVNILSCHRCNAPAFDPETVKTNRGGLCEKCFVDEISKEFAKEDKRLKLNAQKKDAQAKAKGYLFKVVAWIHPAHGDDIGISWYDSEKPTKVSVEKVLKRKKSLVLDDYKILTL